MAVIDTITSTEFLMRVWREQCQPGEFVCLSAKGSSWKDYSFPFDDNLEHELEQWLENHKTRDMYFCPLPFREGRRVKSGVVRSRFLWSDIDDGDWHKSEPTVLWESSPGRFQGLWKLPNAVDPERAAEMSKAMAYHIGADRGGWDLTQVLRIPGTPNLKYEEKPIVTFRHWNTRLLKSVPQGVLDRWRKALPAKLVKIIEGPAEQGRRSDMLWYLEHEMCDLGVPIKDVFEILRGSAWNKYKDRGDEDERFESEMEKIRADRGEKGSSVKEASRELKFISYEDLMRGTDSEPGWMIEGVWMRNSHGIIAGQPKSFKSTLCMDMLFSVATGKPFLGREVHQTGPVLVIQNENADWIMKDRLAKLAHSHGMLGSVVKTGKKFNVTWPKGVVVRDHEGKPRLVDGHEVEVPIPIEFVNQQSFMLDDADNKQALEARIAETRPVVVVLDPLYLMFAGDVNSAKELAPVLQWCLYIKQTYKCSVILIHHYGKGGEEKRGGQRMLGSTTLHGWVESAWYIQVEEPDGEASVVSVECEFRGAASAHLDVAITMSDMGKELFYCSEMYEGGNITDDIMAALSLTDGLTLQQLVKKVVMSKDKIQRALGTLINDGLVKKDGMNYVKK